MRTRQQSFIKNRALCAFQLLNICDVIQLISGIFALFERFGFSVLSSERTKNAHAAKPPDQKADTSQRKGHFSGKHQRKTEGRNNSFVSVYRLFRQG